MTALYERENVLAAIRMLLDKSRRDTPRALFIAGEPGLGKTSLLAHARGKADGFEVRTATCTEVETWLPFGLLDRLFEGLEEPGVGASGKPAEVRVARFAAIRTWLRQQAAIPLLLAVDDLHWADLDSLELLSVLLRRMEKFPVAVIAAMRPWPPMALDQARLLAHDGMAVVERIEALSDEASAAVLGQQLARPMPSDDVTRACRACAGNPLLLREVARAWEQGQGLLSAAGGVLAGRILLPRFAGVGHSAFQWASAASVLGTRFRPRVVASLSGQVNAETAQAMQALSAAGLLLSGEDGTAEFTHPLFRQALYDDLAAPLRLELHTTAFKVLRAYGADTAEAARHAVNGELYGDPDAISVLILAGREALAAGAVATATEHLEGALRLAGARTDRRGAPADHCQ